MYKIPLPIVGLSHYRGSDLVRRLTPQVAIIRRRLFKKWVTDDWEKLKFEPSLESEA